MKRLTYVLNENEIKMVSGGDNEALAAIINVGGFMIIGLFAFYMGRQEKLRIRE